MKFPIKITERQLKVLYVEDGFIKEERIATWKVVSIGLSPIK